ALFGRDQVLPKEVVESLVLTLGVDESRFQVVEVGFQRFVGVQDRYHLRGLNTIPFLDKKLGEDDREVGGTRDANDAALRLETAQGGHRSRSFHGRSRRGGSRNCFRRTSAAGIHLPARYGQESTDGEQPNSLAGTAGTHDSSMTQVRTGRIRLAVARRKRPRLSALGTER